MGKLRKAPECCKRPMELKCAYAGTGSFVGTNPGACFQCSKCGQWKTEDPDKGKYE